MLASLNRRSENVVIHPFVGAMNPGKEMGPNPLRNQDPPNDSLL
jgi:hypothetical protein